MKRVIESLVKAFFPKRCAYCSSVIKPDRLMCNECSKSLPRIDGDVCTKCGRGKKECSCKDASMFFTALAAPFYFSGNVRKGIHAFKFRKCPGYSDAYAFEMANTVKDRFADIDFDLIIDVPMTEKSKKNRGYNQCSLLAEKIALNLGIEYKSNVLSKIYETDKQHLLKLFLRKGNLIGVFDVANPDMVKDKIILLCDDVSTSGETLNECAKMLWLYGAKEIYCIALALTLRNK